MVYFKRIIQGMLVGLGAVLPGVSGGVLCVVFGIYKPIMSFLANPFKNFKEHMRILIPVGIGVIIGFVGIANILAFVLDKYPNQSVCLFIGLIVGMFPSLFKEARQEGTNKYSYVSFVICFVIMLLLLGALKVFSISIEANTMWYVFCGFCLALSIIAPGMSFSTLLMPMGLYAPFVEGLGHLDMSVCIPAGIGAIVTILSLVKLVNYLLKNHYSVTFHGILGIVISATIMTIPFSSFNSLNSIIVNIVCFVIGLILSILLDRFNSRFSEGSL